MMNILWASNVHGVGRCNYSSRRLRAQIVVFCVKLFMLLQL